MSEDTKVVSKNKLNKKLLIGAEIIIAIVLVVVLAVFVPKAAEASKITEQLKLGNKYLDELKYEQAEAAYLAVIEIDPKNVDAYLGLADIYVAQGKYDEAERILGDVLEELDGNATVGITEKLEEIHAVKIGTEVYPTEKPIETLLPPVINTPISTPTVTPSENFTWKENTDGTLILKKLVNKDLIDVIIPKEVDGKLVTVIEESAFRDCSSMIEIIIPEGIISIGDRAFDGCSSLRNIQLPNTLEEIGYHVFEDCESLESLYIPASVRTFGGYSSSSRGYIGNPISLGNKFKSFVVDENNKVFAAVDGSLYSKNLTLLLRVPCAEEGVFVIPEFVEEVYYEAFGDCSNITEIVVQGSKLKEFLAENSCFSGCNSLERFVVEDSNLTYSTLNGVLMSKDGKQIEFVPNKAAQVEFIVPDTVTSICTNAFSSCIELEKVYIPASIKDICAHTCSWGQGNLKDVNIFDKCVSLKEIIVDLANKEYKSIDGVLFTADGTTLLSMPRNYPAITYMVPEGVEKIAEGAFANCNQLVKVVLPDSLGIICNWAFGGCTSLTNIVIPGSVTVIDEHAFIGCTNLTEIILPEGITKISFGTFVECMNLTNIVIPSSVKTIDDAAFVGCTNLTEIVLPEEITEIGGYVFGYCDKLTIVTSPGSYAEQYGKENGIPVMTTLPTSTPTTSTVVVSGIEYTKVPLESASIGNVVEFGSYEQDNDLSNGEESIEWIVLEVKENEALIISLYGLDCQPYNTELAEVTWETCSIRKWLNEEFYYNAFSIAQRNRIIETLLPNQDNPFFGTGGGNDTLDNVFLLSMEEAYLYFPDDQLDENDEWYDNRYRATCPTAYAKRQGKSWTEGNDVWFDGNTKYWLRTSGNSPTCAVDVYYNGLVNDFSDGDVNVSYAVRPALWIALNP